MKRWAVAMSALFVSACNTCVARGAKVKTPRGLRNVEDLRVGDEILVVDPSTLELHVSVITDVRASKRECGRLHFDSGSLTLTSAHPLYDPRAKSWAAAGDWLLGVREELLGELGPMRVTRTERFAGFEEVFDLSVAHELHTFVADGVVVHNKSPMLPTCAPTDDGQVFTGYDLCECGPLLNGAPGAVDCVGANAQPMCMCGGGSSWSVATGASEAVLRDGLWWASVDQRGPSQVLSVEPLTAEQRTSTRPSLLGTPNVLNIADRGDGSEGFLAREAASGEQPREGSLWFSKGVGFFPRALSLGEGQLVLLGVDEDAVWLQPAFDANGTPTSVRWVMHGVPANTWLLFSWRVEVLSGARYQVQASVMNTAGLFSDAFEEEGSGQLLTAFNADGGAFSTGDAGAPWAMWLGHRSASDGGTGLLRVTGVTMSVR